MVPIILLSPSKTLQNPLANPSESWKAQLSQGLGSANSSLTLGLLKALEAMSLNQLQEYYGVSLSIAEKLNVYYSENPPIQPVWTWYTGEAFKYLDLPSLKSQGGKGWTRAVTHLVILSSLYGAHRPEDLMRPYRLDFTLPFPPDFHQVYTKSSSISDSLSSNFPKTMRGMWEQSIQQYLLDLAQTQETSVVVSCASEEFESLAVSALQRDPKTINSQPNLPLRSDGIDLIRIEFYQRHPKTGKTTKISARAKQARGAFARWVLEQVPDECTSTKEIIDFLSGFNQSGYCFTSVQSDYQGKGLRIFKLVFTQSQSSSLQTS
jgi:cytoplasmic iron level regulating protein YaaA (DUF328/UPF0246 family)